MNAHRMMVLAGVVCLIALAVALWEPEPADDCTEWFNGEPWDDADWPADQPNEPVRARVTCFYGARTTIEPLVSTSYLRRRDDDRSYPLQ